MQMHIPTGLAIGAILVGAATAHAAEKRDSFVRWQSVTGIVQGGNVVGSGTGAVTGAPGPWSALGGHVVVDMTAGRLEFDVRGLVFAGGNAIGTTGPVEVVRGTLVCDTDGSATLGNSVLVDTPLVTLDDEGNAHFNGGVAIPAVCASEPDVAFLVRVGSGRWIGNGVVLR